MAGINCSSRQVHQDNVRIVPHAVEYDLFAIRRNIEALYLELRLQVRKLALLAGFQVNPAKFCGSAPPHLRKMSAFPSGRSGKELQWYS